MCSRAPSCPFIFSEPLPPFSPPPPPPFSSSPPSPPSLSLHALSLSSPSSRALRPFLLSPPPLTCFACVLTPSPPPHMLWGLHGPWRAGAVGGAIMHGGPLQEEAGGRSEYFCVLELWERQP
ncbi:unnamed protein product, partial [Closterium sp. Naga37s-1]